MILYIGHLSASTCSDDLRCMFAGFGKVVNAAVITDRFAHESKGFGFVEMPINAEADLAIRSLNGKFVDGTSICNNIGNHTYHTARQPAVPRKMTLLIII